MKYFYSMLLGVFVGAILSIVLCCHEIYILKERCDTIEKDIRNHSTFLIGLDHTFRHTQEINQAEMIHWVEVINAMKGFPKK